MRTTWTMTLALLAAAWLVAPAWAAIANPGNTAAASATSGTSLTLDSWTPGANDLIIVAVAQKMAGGALPTVDGSANNLTFIQVADGTSGGGAERITVFRAMAASPTAGSIVVNRSTGTKPWVAQAYRFSGVNTSGTNGSGAVGTPVTAASPVSDDNDMLASVTTTASNAWVGGFGAHRNSAGSNTFSVPGGESGISINNGGGTGGDNTTLSAWYESVPSAATINIGELNDLASAADWAMVGIEIKPSTNSPLTIEGSGLQFEGVGLRIEGGT